MLPQRAIHRNRFVRADLFIVSLVLSVTFGLVWACVQASGNIAWAYVFLALYLLTTTVLFGSIPQILAYVLQACCCPGEKSSRSKWHEE